MERATEATDAPTRPVDSAPARWARRYFTSPRARAAFLARVARHTTKGRR